MDLNLKGKRALVTGASAGLGAAAAMGLAAEGVELAINARRADKLGETAETIFRATGSRPRVVAGDVSRMDDVGRIIRAVGDVDILVSNAGGPPPGQFTDHSIERWDEAGRLVLSSAVNLTRAVIESMIRRKWGRLIYITSVGVLQPIDDLVLSNAFRAAVTGLCKTISNNYARYGITANCVCPGYTATERLLNLARARGEAGGKSPDGVLKEFAAMVPAGRLGRPEELAALIAFLASDGAAYITGTSIPVDGGLVKALI